MKITDQGLDDNGHRHIHIEIDPTAMATLHLSVFEREVLSLPETPGNLLCLLALLFRQLEGE